MPDQSLPVAEAGEYVSDRFGGNGGSGCSCILGRVIGQILRPNNELCCPNSKHATIMGDAKVGLFQAKAVMSVTFIVSGTGLLQHNGA